MVQDQRPGARFGARHPIKVGDAVAFLTLRIAKPTRRREGSKSLANAQRLRARWTTLLVGVLEFIAENGGGAGVRLRKINANDAR
jgi:hypothetical protein